MGDVETADEGDPEAADVGDLEKFIDEQIQKHGLVRVLAAPAGFLLAIGASALPFLGLYGPLVALGLIATEAIIIAVYYRSRVEATEGRERGHIEAAKKREARGNEVRRMLRDYILRLTNPTWHYVTVIEEFAVGADGDTRVASEWTIQVTGEAPLHFLELKFWGPPLTESERVGIQSLVRFGPEKATLAPVDLHWTQEGDWDRLTVYAYMPRPVTKDDPPFTLSVEYRWPRLFKGLTISESEKQTWTFRRQPEEFRYTFNIGADIGVRGLRCGIVGLSKQPECISEAGSWRIVGVEKPGPAPNEAVSLTLDPT